MSVRARPAEPRATMPGAVALVHPFPSLVNSVVVLGIAFLAGASPWTAISLALAMLAIQFCIGAANDLADQGLDTSTKPWKPIPASAVTRRTALAIAVIAGGGGLLLAGTHGAVVLVLASAMLAAGLAYDFVLKPTAWSWVAYAAALPLLPIYAWWGAAGGLPPRVELLAPLAALAGPALQLTNSLVDLERDRAGGVRSLASVLGRSGALAVAVGIVAAIHTLAWVTLLLGGAPASVLVVAALSTVTATSGLALSASDVESRRELGWQAQVVAIGLLAVAWLAAALG